MNLPKLNDLDVTGKRVIVRMDFDTPEGDLSRIEASRQTLDYLLTNHAKIILIGHKGRPLGDREKDRDLSLKGLDIELSKIIGHEVKLVYDIAGLEAKEEANNLAPGQVMVLENLRFDSREEANDENFVRSLASLGEVYVNEAFAVSHRVHASIVGIPKLLPHAAGMRFEKEIEMLEKIIKDTERPLVLLISGIKKDKLEMVEEIKKLADRVLVAGRLPEFLGGDYHDEKVLVAHLIQDKEDITIHSMEEFEKEIEGAKTIVLAGVIGKVEDEGHQQGTKRVFTAVANSNAYKVAGGGDTEAALTKFGLTEKFSWISVGGGAMLEFLTKRTLPGIEALLR